MKAPSAACASADGAFVVTKDKKNPRPRADRGSKAGCRPGQPAQGTIFRMGFEACARPSDWRRTRRRAQDHPQRGTEIRRPATGTARRLTAQRDEKEEKPSAESSD